MILDLLSEGYIVAPVVLVAVVAVLIFSYGFKPVADPPLNYLLIDDKKTGADKKKREKLKAKPKEKKPVQNGQVAPGEPAVKAKSTVEKNNNTAAVKNVKAEKVQQKTVAKKTSEIQPVVADKEDSVDGNWIQVPSRTDKKQKRKTGTPELTDVSSAESTPAHQPKVTEPASEPVITPAEPAPVLESKPVEPVTLKEEVAKQVQNGEVTRAKEGKKAGKAAKGKQEAKQAAQRAPLIVVDAAPEREPSPAPQTVEPVVPAKTERIPEAAAPAPVQEPARPLTNGEVKSPSGVSSAVAEQPAVGDTNVAFDELGDVWQETRAQKKKKKARRD